MVDGGAGVVACCCLYVERYMMIRNRARSVVVSCVLFFCMSASVARPFQSTNLSTAPRLLSQRINHTHRNSAALPLLEKIDKPQSHLPVFSVLLSPLAAAAFVEDILNVPPRLGDGNAGIEKRAGLVEGASAMGLHDDVKKKNRYGFVARADGFVSCRRGGRWGRRRR